MTLGNTSSARTGRQWAIWVDRGAGALLGVFALWGLWTAACAGWAERSVARGTLPDLRAAVHWAPRNPEWWARLGEAEALDRPPAGLADLQHAVALSPVEGTLWLREADIAEKQAHDPALAERCLLRAVAVDRTLAPRWALAEFYQRQKNDGQFWPAMRVALATIWGEGAPLFDECWDVAAGHPEQVPPRALPARPDVWAQYLDYVVEKNRLDLAAPVSDRLLNLQSDGAASQHALLRYCNRLIAAGDAERALAIWNYAARRRWISEQRPLDAHLGHGLGNADFRYPLSGQGFDWRLGTTPDVYTAVEESAHRVRFEFTGKQPEQANLLEQPCVLHASGNHPGHYRLRVRYETRDLNPDTGLRWRIIGQGGSALLADGALVGGGLNDGGEVRTAEFPFTVDGTAPQVAWVRFDYGRLPGTVRIEGSVVLHAAELWEEGSAAAR